MVGEVVLRRYAIPFAVALVQFLSDRRLDSIATLFIYMSARLCVYATIKSWDLRR